MEKRMRSVLDAVWEGFGNPGFADPGDIFGSLPDWLKGPGVVKGPGGPVLSTGFRNKQITSTPRGTQA